MRPKGTPEQLLERRLKAVRMVLDEKLSHADVARKLGVHRNSVDKWVKLHKAGGKKALEVRTPPDRPAALSPKQVRKLIDAILKGAKAAGFETDLWTLPRIARLIEQRCGVLYDVDHLSRLVRSWGLSWQKPKTRPLERSEPLIEQWLKRDWPRIKKKSAD
jgi:transposase